MARVGLHHQREQINGLLWNDDDHVSLAMECRELLSAENEILFVTKCLKRASQNLHVRGLMLSWNTTILPVVVTFLQWSTFVSQRKRGLIYSRRSPLPYILHVDDSTMPQHNKHTKCIIQVLPKVYQLNWCQGWKYPHPLFLIFNYHKNKVWLSN